jgi:hypothetical protein
MKEKDDDLAHPGKVSKPEKHLIGPIQQFAMDDAPEYAWTPVEVRRSRNIFEKCGNYPIDKVQHPTKIGPIYSSAQRRDTDFT